jgi:hypothetical protein
MSVNPNMCEAVQENVRAFVQHGMERLAQFQKTTIDTVNQQCAEMNEKLRESFKGTPEAIVELTEKTVDGWLEAQKSAANAIAQAGAGMAEAAKERSQVASKEVAALSELVQQSVQRTIAAEKLLLDFAAEQNKAVFEAIQRQAA